MKRRVISSLLAVSIVIGTSYTALATPTSDNQKQKIESTRSEYNEVSSKIKDLESELDGLAAKMEPIFFETESNKNEIEKIKLQTKDTEKEIEELQKEIEKKEKVLGARMRGVYKSGGTKSYVSMILTSESFGDFISNVNAVSTIMSMDKEVIDDLDKNKEKLDSQIKELSEKKAKLDELNKENEAKIKEFEKMEKEQKALVEKLNKEKSKISGDLTNLERPLAKDFIATINNPNSTKAQIQNTITALRGLRNQIVSSTVDNEIVKAMEKGREKIAAIESESTINRGSSSTNSNSGTSSNSNGSSNSGTSSGGGQAVAPPASGSADALVAYAYQFIGRPYVLGATGPNSFDCSGFTQYVYKQLGYGLSRTTYTQVNQGRYVPRDQLQKGDLVFSNGPASAPGHVGIYVGNGQIIHAPRTGDVVKVSPIFNYTTARRIL